MDTLRNNASSNSFLVQREGICGECGDFSKARFGYCPISQVEVSRDHPACPNFRKDLSIDRSQKNPSHVNHDGRSTSNLGLHLSSFQTPRNCPGPNPAYCPIYCERYWSCQLVLEEAKKKT